MTQPQVRTAKIKSMSLLMAVSCFSALVQAQTGLEQCGDPFKSWVGPGDYRRAPKDGLLKNVETNHFSPKVEQLISGVTTTRSGMGKDVAYVLGVFPNHHRALLTMMRMAEQDGNDQPREAGLPLECWFDRAVRYTPDDTVVRLMYALWLRKKGRTEESLFHTRKAEEDAKDNPFTHYNVGISYFELNQFELAATAAKRARDLGFPQQGLINRLKSVNQWTEPTP